MFANNESDYELSPQLEWYIAERPLNIYLFKTDCDVVCESGWFTFKTSYLLTNAVWSHSTMNSRRCCALVNNFIIFLVWCDFTVFFSAPLEVSTVLCVQYSMIWSQQSWHWRCTKRVLLAIILNQRSFGCCRDKSEAITEFSWNVIADCRRNRWMKRRKGLYWQGKYRSLVTALEPRITVDV